MKKSVIIISIFIALFPAIAAGQCNSQEKPDWTNGYFQEENNSYIEVTSATGYTESEARNKAAAIIVNRRSDTTGKQVNVQGNEIVVSGNDFLTVKSRVIDEYREFSDGQHRVYLLVQTAKNPVYEFESVQVTCNYGFTPSVFVPGLAQIQKGSTTKGYLFIGGEIALIGGIVVAENLRASYKSKSNSTHDPVIQRNYHNNAVDCNKIRNFFTYGAIALYVVNVIDGKAPNGKKHVIVLGDNHLNITPFATSYSGGISFAFNF
ncbi:MAG: hypothetical protein LBN11_00085 [Tannerella sp.]|jgi:hypothetical protein|nr:hypothetical protein [Tannerella sp.]